MPDQVCVHADTGVREFDERLELEYNPSNWPSKDRSERSRDAVLIDHRKKCQAGASYVYDKYSDRVTTIEYGERSVEQIDIITPTRDAGDKGTVCKCPSLLAYVHGGYWQEGYFRIDSMPLACCATEGGHYFAGVGYLDEAVQLSLSKVVDQVIQAINKLANYASDNNIRSIILCGHSAGAHLISMAIVSPKLNKSAQLLVKGVALLSGVYDIVPLLRTTVLIPGLAVDSLESAKLLSPMTLLAENPIVAEHLIYNVVGYGDEESEAFKTQANNFAKVLADRGVPHRMYIGAGRDHFNLMTKAFDPSDPLSQELVSLLNQSSSSVI